MTPKSQSDLDSSSRYLILPVWLIAIYAIGLLMSDAATICLWIVCAFILFTLLDPMAEFLKRHRWPTFLSAIVLVFIATAVAGGLIYLFGWLFSEMVIDLQKSKAVFKHTFNSIYKEWKHVSAQLSALGPNNAPKGGTVSVPVVPVDPGATPAPTPMPTPIPQQAGGPSPISEMGGTILHGVSSAVTVLTFSLLIPILTFFLLAERDALGKVFAKAYKDSTLGVTTWKKIVHSTRAFFVGNLILGAITYPVFILLFWLFKTPSLFKVAALATFFNLVPFAGAALAGFLPAVALFTQDQHVGTALGLYGICVIIHFIVADFITPKLLGAQVNINATASTIALVAWGELWGGVGLVLAIPITSIIKILFEQSNFPWLQWIAALMSEGADHAIMPTKVKKSS